MILFLHNPTIKNQSRIFANQLNIFLFATMVFHERITITDNFSPFSLRSKFQLRDEWSVDCKAKVRINKSLKMFFYFFLFYSYEKKAFGFMPRLSYVTSQFLPVSPSSLSQTNVHAFTTTLPSVYLTLKLRANES